MAISGQTIRNLGKSIAYSSLDVLGQVAPNTASLARGARSGLNSTRDFIRLNQGKIRSSSAMSERSTLGRRAKNFLADAWKDVKQGNLALGDMSQESFDDWEQQMSDWGDMSGGGGDDEFGDTSASANNQTPYIPTDYRTIAALGEVTEVVSGATLKAAEYQTQQISTVLFTQMAAQNQHFVQLEQQLDTINSNLVQLVEFQRDSQGVTNQANMQFYDQIINIMKKQEKREAERSKRTKRATRTAGQRLLMNGFFDMDSYGEVIKENISSSPLGMMMSMMGAVDPSMLAMSMGGKVQPQRFALEKMLGLLIPGQTRRSIGRMDRQVNTMAKTLLTQLGSYQYQIDKHPILGVLGSIFGVNPRVKEQAFLGRYKRGDMNWNGEAQRVLTTVIPKELAEIKAAILKKNVEYYDARTGTFQDESAIREEVRRRYQNAAETPFANIFNSMSIDPDSVSNKKIWTEMTDDAKESINAIINQAVNGSEGLTQELRRQLDAIMTQSAESLGATRNDAIRMTMMLTESVNTARANLASFFEDLESETSSFSQLAPKLANAQGIISRQKMNEFMGADRIDVAAANRDRYTLDGRRLDQMSEAERRRYESNLAATQSFRQSFEGLRNHPNRAVAAIGTLLGDFVDMRRGARVTRRSQAMTNAVERVNNGLFDVAMLGQNPFQRRQGGETGDAGPDVAPIAESEQAPEQQQEGRRRRRKERKRRRMAPASTAVSQDTDTGGADTSEDVDRNDQRSEVPSSIISAASSAASNIQDNDSGLQGHVDTNSAYTDAVADQTPEMRTASATEELRDQNEAAFGKKGFMRKFFDSPAIKKFLDWFGNTEFGKKVKAKASQVGDFFKGIGNEGLGQVKDLGRKYLNMMKQSLGLPVDEIVEATDQGDVSPTADINHETTSVQGEHSDRDLNLPAQVDVRDQLHAEAMESIRQAREISPDIADDLVFAEANRLAAEVDEILGTDGKDPSKTKGQILDSFKSFLTKYLPRGAAGGIIGGGLGLAAGGSMGLIGGLFLPGGPIGGAILGTSIGLLSQTEAFQNIVFGKMNEQGEREGGLINQEMVKGLKDMLPTLGIGAGAGIIAKLLGGALGVSMPGVGVLTSALLPGGVLGAALIGSAGAFMLKNKKVQDILFGPEDENGKRTGSALSNMYNKLTGKIRGMAGEGQGEGIGKRVLGMLKGAGIGLIANLGLGQMGLIGSTLSFGGPIGAAIAGAAFGILGSSQKFNDYLYGTKGEDGKRKKDGLLSRFSTMLKLNFIEPASHWFSSTAEEFAWWAKEKIEVPFRLAFGPIVDAFHNMGDAMKDTATGVIEKVGEKVTGTIENILRPIGGAFMKFVLKPLGSVAGGLLKGGLFAAGSMIGAPFQLMSMLMSGKRREGQGRFGDFLRANKEENLQNYWDAQEAETGEKRGRFGKFMDRMHYGAASMRLKLPFVGEVGSIFRNSDMMSDMAHMYGEETGDNALDWLSAKHDKKQYRQNRKDTKADYKDYKKILKQRQAWAKADKNNQDLELDDDTFKKRQKELKRKYGIEISSKDELKQFTYDYDKWKDPTTNVRSVAEAAAAQAAEEAAKEQANVERVEDIREKTGGILGVLKGIFDVMTGRTVDSDDISDNPEDVGDKIDSGDVANIVDAENNEQANAIAAAIDRENDNNQREAEKQAEHDRITGNQSGNAHDEEEGVPADQNIQIEVGEGEKKSSFLDTILSMGGTLLTSILPAVMPWLLGGGLIALLIMNEDFRNWVFGLLSDLGQMILEGLAPMLINGLAGLAEGLGGLLGDAVNFAITGVGDLIGAGVEGLGNLLDWGVSGLGNIVGDIFGAPLKIFGDVFTGIGEGLFGGGIFKGIGDAASSFGEGASGFFDNFAWGIFSPVGHAIDFVSGGIGSGLNMLGDGIGNLFSGVTKAFDSIGNALDTAGEKVSDGISGAFEFIGSGISAAAETAGNFVSDVISKGGDAAKSGLKWIGTTLSDGIKGIGSLLGFGPGPNNQGFGLGPVMGYGLQADPRWANMPIGRFPNGQISTMADGGCGPTAFSDAAARLGLGTNPASVASFAMQNGYISDGGANAGLFERGSNAFGMKASKVGSANAIKQSLMSGNPVILSGKSRSSGYGSNPYTAAGHIVTASGIDNRGNVLVDDPMRGRGIYKLSDLTQNMTGGWSMSRKGKAAGYGLLSSTLGSVIKGIGSAVYNYFGLTSDADESYTNFDSGVFSSGGLSAGTNSPSVSFTGNTEKENIWNYLLRDGYNKFAAAGIMGCWEQESSNSANTVEGYYLKGYPGTETVLASNQNLDNFVLNVLFPAYERSGISISKNGYKGEDGHYYPGIGLAQWTGPRGYKLFRWANTQNYDWRKLATQLKYFDNEVESRGIKSKLNSVASPEAGARAALDYYEMYEGYSNKAPSALQKRQKFARAIYDKYATGYGAGPAGYGILSSLLNPAFQTITNAVFHNDLWDIENDENNSSDSTMTFGGVNGTYSSQPVSSTQLALVNKMKSVQGKLNYTLGSPQDPDQGAASCVSTVGWAYKKVMGLTGMSAGSSTLSRDILSGKMPFTPIWVKQNSSDMAPTDIMQPGDVVFQNWDRQNQPWSNNISNPMKHTEMYAGSQQDLSHGGPNWSDKGPVYKAMDDSGSGKYRRQCTMMVARHNNFLQASTDSASSAVGAVTGSALSGVSAWLSRGGSGYGGGPLGYGPGPDTTTFNISKSGQRYVQKYPIAGFGNADPNQGVETRLDVIIAYMRRIVENIDTPEPLPTTTNFNTVNYGPGETKVESKPTVVVNNTQQKQLGNPNARNSYLRQVHARIASAQHY